MTNLRTLGTRRPFAVVLAAVALSFGPTAVAQSTFAGSPVQPTASANGIFVVLNTPSRPGDLFYKGLPQNRLRTTSGVVHVGSLQGVFLGDVDWPNGPPSFYDIGISRSTTRDGLPDDYLVPDFFSEGGLESLISIGNSGLPHPCVVQPTSTCTSSAQCSPTLGYTLDIVFAEALELPVGVEDQNGIAIIEFVPSGMVFSTSASVGSCGQGDYVFQASLSDTEAQAGYLRTPSVSVGQGYQFGGPAGGVSGPLPAPSNFMSQIQLGILEPTIEPALSDPSTGYNNARGGSSIAVDTSTGTASIAAVVSTDPNHQGLLCFPVLSDSQLLVPFDIFGADLLLAPNGTFAATLAAWSATGPLLLENQGLPTEVARVISSSLALPVLPGRRMYLQALIITGYGPITATATTLWAINFE